MRRRKAPHSGKRPTLKQSSDLRNPSPLVVPPRSVPGNCALSVFLLLAVAGVSLYGTDLTSDRIAPAGLCIAAIRCTEAGPQQLCENTLKTWIELSKKVSTRIRKKMGKMASKKSRDSKDDSDTQYPYARSDITSFILANINQH